MAGAFMIATTTLAARRGLMPTWLTVASYAAAVVLLIAASSRPAFLIVMPAWTLAISVAVWAGCRHTNLSSTEQETDR